MIPSAREKSKIDPFNPIKASDYLCPNEAKAFLFNTKDPQDQIFVTCHCEDHCSWYKCKLDTPPLNCLEGENSFWQWDQKRNYWVAQMNPETTSMTFFYKVFKLY